MGKKILLVDDDDLVRKTICSIFDTFNAEYTALADGQSAVDYVRDNHADIALVLMDLQMPGMSGLEAIQHIRQELLIEDLSIMLLSGRSQDEMLDASINAGANGFIAKPFTTETFMTTVKQFLGN